MGYAVSVMRPGRAGTDVNDQVIAVGADPPEGLRDDFVLPADTQVDDCTAVTSAQPGEETVAFVRRNVSLDHDWNVMRGATAEEVIRHFPGVRARTNDGAPAAYDVRQERGVETMSELHSGETR